MEAIRIGGKCGVGGYFSTAGLLGSGAASALIKIKAGDQTSGNGEEVGDTSRSPVARYGREKKWC